MLGKENTLHLKALITDIIAKKETTLFISMTMQIKISEQFLSSVFNQ